MIHNPTENIMHGYIFSNKLGNRNWAIYPPNTPCEAFPGSPIFLNTWTLITWWPGTEETLKVFSNGADAFKAVKEM